MGVATVWIELEAWHQAEELLNRARDDYPDDPRLHNSLGLLAWRTGRSDEAAAHFRKAIELAPNWEVPQQNLAALQQD